MAGPINTPVTGNIWHLSIDDLFAPLPEKTRLGGAGPFVINLSVSTAPIDPPPKGFDAGRDVHAYRVQRTEDRRMRYRLRLGPFANEDDADAALEKVRDVYPGALTATADADDLRALAPLQAKAEAQQSLAAAKADLIPTLTAAAPMPAAAPMAVAVPMPAAVPMPVAAPMPTAKAEAQQSPAAARADLIPTLTAAEPLPVAKAAKVAKVAEPAPAVLSLVEPAAKPTVAKPAAITQITPKAPATKPVAMKPAAAAPPNPAAPSLVPSLAPSLAPPAVPAPAPVGEPTKRILSVESTQTVRALSLLELESEQASRWFVIQLSQSEQAFDSEAVPNLDIFSVYRLYSVAGIDEGRIVHALRLGFFSEEIAAAAVASYLSSFYDKPSVRRVSSAERDRFADHRFEPRKDVGATGRHAVIEITDERYIREKRNIQPRTATQNNK